MPGLRRAGLAARSVPLAIFATVELFALGLWMVIGRNGWFYLDEWDFLAARKSTDVGAVFRPHNEHWVTLPFLAYRVLYRFFGLRAYLPYRLLAVLVYLAVAALLLVVMRRAGVNAWIATAVASLFALFGAGWQNILEPFQITFTSSLALGLAFLLVADHDGPFDRRDAAAVLIGLLALMTSAIAVVLVIVVGIAVLLRRGWRLAILHVAPLAACYGVWLLIIGHSGGHPRNHATGHITAGRIVRFVSHAVHYTLRSLGPDTRLDAGFTVAALVVLVIGLAVAVRMRRRLGRLAQLAAPIALLCGTVMFLVVTATGRAGLGSNAPRFLSVVAATMLPALAVAVDAVTRSRRWLVPVAIAVLLCGIPRSLHHAANAQRSQAHVDATVREVLLTIPRVPLAPYVPPSVTPEPYSASRVTVGWLLDGVRRGQIPAPSEITPNDVASDNFRLSISQGPGRAPTTNCRIVRRPFVLSLKRGDTIGLHDGNARLAPAGVSFVIDPIYIVTPSSRIRLVVLRDLGRVLVAPLTDEEPWPRLCTGRG